LNIHSLKLHLATDIKNYKWYSVDAPHYEYYHKNQSYKIVDIKGLSVKKLVIKLKYVLCYGQIFFLKNYYLIFKTEDFRQKFIKVKRQKTTREHIQDVSITQKINVWHFNLNNF
jgi:hypothetical protein